MTPICANAKPPLCTAALSSMQQAVKALGEPAFRAKQLYDWVRHKLILDPDKMLNLPKSLREKLPEQFTCCSSVIETEATSSDKTTKLLLRLEDGEAVEMVIIRTPERATFCMSTQVGCPVRCRFCASGADGFVRNLEVHEIIEQLFHGVAKAGRVPDNIVFMGIGEGLLNFNNLRDALLLLSNRDGYGIAQRRITVSTSGYVPGMYKLAELEKQFELAVSLHAPDDTMRAELIPDMVRYPISEIMAACSNYLQKTGRIPTFEYTLIEGINDAPEAAKELVLLAKQQRAKINLIPYNETPNNDFRRPSIEKIKRFAAILERGGVSTTCRIEKGTSTSAACGQLRAAKKIKEL
jgi:23S rRNA (adenine2503-C2)-methyltransferase